MPVFGPFNTQVDFMAAMFKRFEGSGLLKLIASAGIVAEISVNKALKGQHFRRTVRTLQLVCKALQLGIIINGVRVGIKLSLSIQTSLQK